MLTAVIIAALSVPFARAATPLEEGFTALFDGKTFAGWRLSEENTNSWKIEDGALVTRGQRSHLFYVGDERTFRNFELKVEVMTETNSNGGIFFHTRYQPSNWPTNGFECQVNVTQSDWKKTGSLYDVANLGVTPARDNTWWTQHITVNGRRVTVRIDGVIVLEYTEPDGAQPGRSFTRKLGDGTFALQAHDPRSVVRYRNIRVKRLD